jgi:hypothetical protein
VLFRSSDFFAAPDRQLLVIAGPCILEEQSTNELIGRTVQDMESNMASLVRNAVDSLAAVHEDISRVIERSSITSADQIRQQVADLADVVQTIDRSVRHKTVLPFCVQDLQNLPLTWPQLSAAEHAAQVKELEAFVAEAREAFPALEVSNTHEFIVATDIPAGQMAPYLASLDAMHDFLCDLYGIPRGEPVWLGKCLVVAFLKEDDFLAFEGRFMGLAPPGVHGLCHQRSDGRVVMACHRGDDASAFAHMLVHETSHGFNHRWLSPARLPNWLNEGIAEWVGTQVVPACRQVPLKEAKGVEFMKASGSVGPGFFDDGPDAHINPLQYGIASGLVKFMVARDRKQFAAFVQGVKEGLSVEQSLKNSFRASLDDLVKAYGKAVGVPNLAR